MLSLFVKFWKELNEYWYNNRSDYLPKLFRHNSFELFILSNHKCFGTVHQFLVKKGLHYILSLSVTFVRLKMLQDDFIIWGKAWQLFALTGHEGEFLECAYHSCSWSCYFCISSLLTKCWKLFRGVSMLYLVHSTYLFTYSHASLHALLISCLEGRKEPTDLLCVSTFENV